MDRRRSGGYGSGSYGSGGNRYSNNSGNSKQQGGDGEAEPGGGGRWENDMYESTQQSHQRDGGFNNAGGNQWGGNRQGRGGGGRGGRGRNYGFGGGDRSGDGFSREGGGGGARRDYRGGGYGRGQYSDNNQSNQSNGQDNNWGNTAGGSGVADNWAGGGERDPGAGGGGWGSGEEGGLPMASERWQQHAQAVAAGRGGGGGFHQRHGRSQSQPDPDAKREQGYVCFIKENFGFVRCVDRTGDLFFHLTEAPQDINIGDEVDFVVGTGGRSGKDFALQLHVLPTGTVKTDTVLEGLFVGVIERDIRSFHPTMPSSQRAQMMGRSRAHDHQQPEGLIKITGAAPPEYLPAPVVEESEEDASTQEVGDEIIASPENVEIGAVSATVQEQEVEGVEDQAPEEDAEHGVSTVGAGAPTTPRATAALGLTGAMVVYGVGDIVEEDAGPRLRRGDEVLLRVSQENVTGKKKGVEISLLKTSKEKRKEEQLQKLIDSGASRHQGVVKRLSHDYGFLLSTSLSESVYFNVSQITDGEGGDSERLLVGSQAEFWVVPDRDKDGRNSYRALDIKILPPGTLILEENVYECVRGIVARAPTLAQRSNFGGGRDGGGGGGTRPGAGKFTVVPVVTDEEKGDRGVVSGKEEVLVASLHPKELGKTNVPTLEAGDVIEADIWQSNIGGKQCHAKNVRVIEFGGSREEGVVRSLREGGFGFIHPLQGGDDVYFRVGDVCRNLPDIQEGSEALFTVKDSDRGGDKKRGTRVEILPQGTLQLEVPLVAGVSGVVTQDVKGRGPGMITITDGNALELPLMLKFPKIAARVRDFVAQTSKTELTFPSTLTPGERNACQRIAAAEGLGQELRGEESRRTLHIWKPESEEEASAVKATEAAREEDHFKAVKERSKNGERSLSVPFSRRDIAFSMLEENAEKDTNNPNRDLKNAPNGGDPDKTSKANRYQLTQDFRKEDRGSSGGAKRGDLVTFDVILNRGTMKRRATNIKVVKRASAVAAANKVGANSRDTDKKLTRNTTVVAAEGVGKGAGAGGGVGIGNNDQKECLGVVSLVNTDRHFGFIDAMESEERVFFHLSEVVPESAFAAAAAAGRRERRSNVAGVNTVAQDNKQQEASVNAEMLQRDAVVKAGDGNSDGTPTSILHHNTTGTPENSAEKMTKTNNSAGGGHSKFNGVNAGGGGGGGAIIKRGQEVSFRLGQRQGKPLGLCVKKLKSGTLPLCEELLPSRFVGVVVVAPRMIAAATAAGAATSSTGGGGVGGIIETETIETVSSELEGMLVMLYEKKGSDTIKAVGKAGVIDGSGSPGVKDGDEEVERKPEATKEATKAQRMLSSAGLGLRSPGSTSLTSSATVSPTKPDLLPDPAAVSDSQERSSSTTSTPPPGQPAQSDKISTGTGSSSSLRVGGALHRGPPRYALMRFAVKNTEQPQQQQRQVAGGTGSGTAEEAEMATGPGTGPEITAAEKNSGRESNGNQAVAVESETVAGAPQVVASVSADTTEPNVGGTSAQKYDTATAVGCEGSDENGYSFVEEAAASGSASGPVSVIVRDFCSSPDEVCAQGDEGIAIGNGDSGVSSSLYQRGDLVEFEVFARRALGGVGGGGQRGQGQGPQLRVGKVSLLEKCGLKCRRGNLLEVDGRGTAHIECSMNEEAAGSTDEEEHAEAQDVNDSDKTVVVAAADGDDHDDGSVGKDPRNDADKRPTFFFSLKEMVGAGGPLRKGDELEFLVPAGKVVEAGRRAVGAIRVQDLKSLSGTRQRLNLNLRDAQKGPQVRMAQGPDGAGFRPGYRATLSLYAGSAPTPAVADSSPTEGTDNAQAEIPIELENQGGDGGGADGVVEGDGTVEAVDET